MIFLSLLIGPMICIEGHLESNRFKDAFNEQVLVGVLSPMRSFWARHLAREAWASPQNMERQRTRVLFLLAQDRWSS